MAQINAYTTKNFETEVLQSKGVSVVRFWADWCGPCTAMKPIYGEIAEELQKQVAFGEVDIDHSPEIANAFGIRSIPTIVIFKDGKPVDGIVGMAQKSLLVENIRWKI